MEIKFLDNFIGKPITRHTPGSAGFDLHYCEPEPLDISGLIENTPVLVGTGIAIDIESDSWCGLVFARSSLGHNHDIQLSNGVGVIDSDYQGQIMLSLVKRPDSRKLNPPIQPGIESRS